MFRPKPMIHNEIVYLRPGTTRESRLVEDAPYALERSEAAALLRRIKEPCERLLAVIVTPA